MSARGKQSSRPPPRHWKDVHVESGESPRVSCGVLQVTEESSTPVRDSQQCVCQLCQPQLTRGSVGMDIDCGTHFAVRAAMKSGRKFTSCEIMFLTGSHRIRLARFENCIPRMGMSLEDRQDGPRRVVVVVLAVV